MLSLKRVTAFEWWSLLICIFSIPLFESPKIIFLAISGVFFLIQRYLKRDYKEALLKADPRLGFLALFAAAALSAIFAHKPLLAFDGSLDFLKMYLIFVIIATDFTDSRSIKKICLTVIISTTIASVWGIIEYATGRSHTIELRSVGHVNHSAIYLSIVLVLAISLFRYLENRLEKIFIVLSSFIILLSLILTGSRATVLGIIAALVSIFIFSKKKKQFAYIFVTIIVTVVIILISVPNLQLLQKNTSLSDNSLIERISLWKNAWELFISHPIFGVGAKHFRLYNTHNSGSHAHNLYFNTIAQLGIVGFISFVLILYLIIKSLKASYYNRESSLWTAALGVFIIVLVNGIFNTTLHSEHGLLFALILATGLNNSYNNCTS